MSLDLEEQVEMVEVPKVEKKSHKVKVESVKSESSDGLINCLRNERLIVRHIPRQSGMQISNPKHIAYGGMLENATKTFCVPMLESGNLVNVLTNSEKEFLEDIMGLEYNTLSIYKKEDNYWFNRKVVLRKQDNYLDLSDPEQYIDYKILLANKNYIAKSLQELEDCPKATYQFVIISEGEEAKKASTTMSVTMQCYKEYGKIEDDIDTLRAIVETIDGRPLSSTTKADFIKSKINDLIQANSKLFLKVITDPLLSTKVLIKKSIEAGLIANRGNMLYLIDGNSRTPLCEDGEEPTLNIAAKYLSNPKRQQIKFALEGKLK